MIDALGLHEAVRPMKNQVGPSSSGDPTQDVLKRLRKMKDACSQLESLFVNTLLKALRETVPGGGIMPEGAGSEIYLSMAEQQVATYLSQGKGLGLGQAVFHQVLRREDPEGLAAKDPELVREAGAKRVSRDFMPDNWTGPFLKPAERSPNNP